eukprot:3834200-Rhodomonas_salina.2
MWKKRRVEVESFGRERGVSREGKKDPNLTIDHSLELLRARGIEAVIVQPRTQTLNPKSETQSPKP